MTASKKFTVQVRDQVFTRTSVHPYTHAVVADFYDQGTEVSSWHATAEAARKAAKAREGRIRSKCYQGRYAVRVEAVKGV